MLCPFPMAIFHSLASTQGAQWEESREDWRAEGKETISNFFNTMKDTEHVERWEGRSEKQET